MRAGAVGLIVTTGMSGQQVVASPAPPPRPAKPLTEDEIARYYWPEDMGEPAPWFRSAISDAFDSGIAFAVRRGAEGT